jgi:hypothetical protein
VREFNRWWFSQKYSDHLKDVRERTSQEDRPSFCEIFVDGEWKEYTEWTAGENSKPHFDDAILLAESYRMLPYRVNGKEQTIT